MSHWPVGFSKDIHDILDSTSAEAMRQIAAGRRTPGWILALEQSAGKGRRGRPWSTGRGNFSASLLTFPDCSAGEAALRSFTTSLGLFDAFVSITGRPELFTLKWPNDVLLDGRKLAGILLEASSGGDNKALVTGVGVNLVSAPTPEEIETGAMNPTSLFEYTGVRVTPEEFLAILGPAVNHWEEQLCSAGFDEVRKAWLSRAARLGTAIVARLPKSEVHGIFRSIDETGAIILQTNTGMQKLSAADIHFETTSCR